MKKLLLTLTLVLTCLGITTQATFAWHANGCKAHSDGTYTYVYQQDIDAHPFSGNDIGQPDAQWLPNGYNWNATTAAIFNNGCHVSNTPTPSPSPTVTNTATATATETSTATNTATEVPTNTATATETATATATSTNTAIPSPTETEVIPTPQCDGVFTEADECATVTATETATATNTATVPPQSTEVPPTATERPTEVSTPVTVTTVPTEPVIATSTSVMSTPVTITSLPNTGSGTSSSQSTDYTLIIGLIAAAFLFLMTVRNLRKN